MRRWCAPAAPAPLWKSGTNLGYSATWIAGALPPDGRLICLDIDAELLERARGHLGHARLAERVELRLGRALDLLRDLPGPFDFAYIDANKDDYPAYLDAVVERLRPGGVVAVDNLLWGGQIAMETEDSNRPRQWTPIHQGVQPIVPGRPAVGLDHRAGRGRRRHRSETRLILR